MNNSTWKNVSGTLSSVMIAGGNRTMQEFQPLWSDTVMGIPGARSRAQISVRTVYTENTTEARKYLESAYQSKNMIYMRWSPTGGAPDDVRYVAVNAYVTDPGYAAGDVSDAKPLIVEYKISAEYIEEETVE